MILLGYIVGAFLLSILVFSCLYYVVYKISKPSKVRKKMSGTPGLHQQHPAFFASEIFKARMISEAINDLRLLKFLGEVRFDRWHSFDKGLMLHTSGFDPEQLAEQRLLDISATEMVEVVFARHGQVEIQVVNDSPFRSFRESVSTALYGKPIDPSFANTGKIYTYEEMFGDDVARIGEIAAEGVRLQLQVGQRISLRELSIFAKSLVKRLESEGAEIPDLKDKVYSQILMAFSMNNSASVSFDRVEPDVRFGDFLHYAAVTGTVNATSELIPMHGLPRIITVAQLLISFLMLGAIVAGVVAVLDIA